MNPKEIFKNIIQGYVTMIKRYAILVGGGVLGGIILICVMAGGIGGGDESMDGGGTISGTVNSGGMSSAMGSASYGTSSLKILTEPSIGREEFIEIVQNYLSTEEYHQRCGQYADKIYDICVNKGINPVICFAQGANESDNFTKTPGNSPYNFWGLGVHNDTNVGIEYNGFELAVNRILQLYIKICK